MINEQLILERLALLEKRVAQLEQSRQSIGPLPIKPYPMTGLCPICYQDHRGLPCPRYIVTCDINPGE